MIRIPKLNPQQKKDLDELKLNNGFMILVESFERSIKENNVKLANWDFDSYIDKTKNGQDEFIKIQRENDLLKSFMILLMSTNEIKSNTEINLDTPGVYT